MFRFKQFSVQHDLCAMKVGTDGVLLGAWAGAITDLQRVLDVGCGSGVIALMLAQKMQKAEIDAIDIDENAYNQTVINFKNAPFDDKLTAIHGDFRTFAPTQKYDLIVSNPPYFVDSLPSPNAERTIARHANTLSYSDLIQHSATMLAENGRIALILPFEAFDTIQSLAEANGLTLTRKTVVRPKTGAPPKRILLEYSYQLPVTSYQLSEDELVIEKDAGVFSDAYVALTKDFYLNFPE
nr:methyltransferase [Candidatus Symbiothrix dinenymphae]